jgi:hypothetical protein
VHPKSPFSGAGKKALDGGKDKSKGKGKGKKKAPATLDEDEEDRDSDHGGETQGKQRTQQESTNL